jgi:hypothetical protein
LAEFAEGLRMVKDWGSDEWFPWYMGFTDIEIDKIRRIADWMHTPDPEGTVMSNRRNFYAFFNEHDRRRGTNFRETFPELSEFFDECEKIKKG